MAPVKNISIFRDQVNITNKVTPTDYEFNSGLNLRTVLDARGKSERCTLQVSSMPGKSMCTFQIFFSFFQKISVILTSYLYY